MGALIASALLRRPLQPDTERLAHRQAKVLVDALHHAARVGNQLFVPHAHKPLLWDLLAHSSQVTVIVVPHVGQGLRLWRLPGDVWRVHLPHRVEQAQQRRDGLVGIAQEQDEPRVGERLQQREDAPRRMHVLGEQRAIAPAGVQVALNATPVIVHYAPPLLERQVVGELDLAKLVDKGEQQVQRGGVQRVEENPLVLLGLVEADGVNAAPAGERLALDPRTQARQNAREPPVERG